MFLLLSSYIYNVLFFIMILYINIIVLISLVHNLLTIYATIFFTYFLIFIENMHNQNKRRKTTAPNSKSKEVLSLLVDRSTMNTTDECLAIKSTQPQTQIVSITDVDNSKFIVVFYFLRVFSIFIILSFFSSFTKYSF